MISSAHVQSDRPRAPNFFTDQKMSGEEEGAMVAGEEETEVAEQGEESGEEVSDTESEDDSEFDDPPEYFDDISDEGGL